MKKKPDLEINCDLGEGILHEEMIFPWIDSASIACGGHFGDENSIRNSIRLAKEFEVKVGAHPSYPDFENFGRVSLDIPFEDLANSILSQIQLFLKIASEENLSADHIKFHGALYNDAAKDSTLSKKLAELLFQNFPETPVFVPPFSEMEKAAKIIGLKTRLEVFGDRSYQDNYQLTPRSQSNALFTKAEQILPQISSIITSNELISSTGKRLPIHAETICIHGDNPGIQNFLPLVRKTFWS